MKKINILFFLIFSVYYGAQISVFAAMKSNDPAEVRAFVEANPKHPKTPELQKKLLTMRPIANSNAAKPVISKLTPEKLEKNIDKSKTSESGSKTAEILTNLFADNATSKQTVLQIVNKSSCNLLVKVSGKKFYNFTVPANNQNYLLVDKGSYTIATSICDASYSQTKSLTANTVITLNNGK